MDLKKAIMDYFDLDEDAYDEQVIIGSCKGIEVVI